MLKQPTKEARRAFRTLLDPKTPQTFGTLWSTDKRSCALGELLYSIFDDIGRDGFVHEERQWLDRNIPRTLQNLIVRLNDDHHMSKQDIGLLLMELYP